MEKKKTVVFPTLKIVENSFKDRTPASMQWARGYGEQSGRGNSLCRVHGCSQPDNKMQNSNKTWTYFKQLRGILKSKNNTFVRGLDLVLNIRAFSLRSLGRSKLKMHKCRKPWDKTILINYVSYVCTLCF